MQFGIPEDNIIRSPRERLVPDRPLRAEGNLSYRGFIATVKSLWEEVYPDIPILPVQGKTYTHYPVIVYSLENRKPHNSEPKQRYREEVVTDGDKNYIIHGQKFQNYIAFSVITDNEPELAETIIETFEEFMHEYTPVWKRLGLSEFLYSRRISDREETRAGGDVCIRTVVYLCIMERLTRTSVSKLQEVLTNVAVVTPTLANYAVVPSAPQETDDGEIIDHIDANQIVNLSMRHLKENDVIRILRPTEEDLNFRPSANTKFIPGTQIEMNEIRVPGGIIAGGEYDVIEVHGDLFMLRDRETGQIVDITSNGWFRWVLVNYKQGTFTTDIMDEFGGSA